MMKRALLAILLLTAACERGLPNKQVSADTANADTTSSAAATTPATQPDSSMHPGTRFDPNAAKIGDHIAGLEVVSKNVAPALQSPVGVSGSMAFKGTVELRGSYRAHFDYPEKQEACFWVDPADWSKLPRMKGDTRLVWFCFTNKDAAIKQLGALGTETHATIVIDDYTTNVQRADVWDTARLVRVSEKHR